MDYNRKYLTLWELFEKEKKALDEHVQKHDIIENTYKYEHHKYTDSIMDNIFYFYIFISTTFILIAFGTPLFLDIGAVSEQASNNFLLNLISPLIIPALNIWTSFSFFVKSSDFAAVILPLILTINFIISCSFIDVFFKDGKNNFRRRLLLRKLKKNPVLKSKFFIESHEFRHQKEVYLEKRAKYLSYASEIEEIEKRVDTSTLPIVFVDMFMNNELPFSGKHLLYSEFKKYLSEEDFLKLLKIDVKNQNRNKNYK